MEKEPIDVRESSVFPDSNPLLCCLLLVCWPGKSRRNKRPEGAHKVINIQVRDLEEKKGDKKKEKTKMTQRKEEK